MKGAIETQASGTRGRSSTKGGPMSPNQQYQQQQQQATKGSWDYGWEWDWDNSNARPPPRRGMYGARRSQAQVGSYTAGTGPIGGGSAKGSPFGAGKSFTPAQYAQHYAQQQQQQY